MDLNQLMRVSDVEELCKLARKYGLASAKFGTTELIFGYPPQTEELDSLVSRKPVTSEEIDAYKQEERELGLEV